MNRFPTAIVASLAKVVISRWAVETLVAATGGWPAPSRIITLEVVLRST